MKNNEAKATEVKICYYDEETFTIQSKVELELGVYRDLMVHGKIIIEQEIACNSISLGLYDKIIRLQTGYKDKRLVSVRLTSAEGGVFDFTTSNGIDYSITYDFNSESSFVGFESYESNELLMLRPVVNSQNQITQTESSATEDSK